MMRANRTGWVSDHSKNMRTLIERAGLVYEHETKENFLECLGCLDGYGIEENSVHCNLLRLGKMNQFLAGSGLQAVDVRNKNDDELEWKFVEYVDLT